jgi:formylglycine-generating enzyme required for sulfatase activity
VGLVFFFTGCTQCAGVDTVDAGAIPNGWVTIHSGESRIGSPTTEEGRAFDEKVFVAVITNSFEISSTEVTQDDFVSHMGYNSSHFATCGGKCPVERVNWHEAAAYCNALSAAAELEKCYICDGTGTDVLCEPQSELANFYACKGYRLPTEVEWEYAARAGTSTASYRGDLDGVSDLKQFCPSSVSDQISWTCSNSEQSTHIVASLDPNPWDLFDMLGNVWEWCQDAYGPYPEGRHIDPYSPPTDELHALRGGSWDYAPMFARAAARDMHFRNYRNRRLGFRPVRTIAEH